MRKRILLVTLFILTIFVLACSTPSNKTSIDKTLTTLGAVLSGYIYYNGRIITDYTNAEAVIELIEIKSWQSISMEYKYVNKMGSFTIEGVSPGEYLPYICIESGYPFDIESGGDFTSRLSGLNPNIVVHSNTDIIQQNLSVVYQVHLTSPIDNQEITRSVNDKPETLYKLQTPSKFLFEWEPVPDAALYWVRIDLKDDNTNQTQTIADQMINTNQYSIDLDVTLENQYYMFLVYGYNSDNDLIGLFRYYYLDGDGGWYNFTVMAE